MNTSKASSFEIAWMLKQNPKLPYKSVVADCFTEIVETLSKDNLILFLWGGLFNLSKRSPKTVEALNVFIQNSITSMGKKIIKLV